MSESAKTAPLSPCVGLCKMADHGHCLGCLRTLEEITCWRSLDASAQQNILDRIPARKHLLAPEH